MTDTRMTVNGLTVDQLLDFHRNRFGDLRMEEAGTGGEGGAGEAAKPKPPEGGEAQTFTQADIDKAVKERLARERAKYADYDDLKAKAGEKTTLEERVAQIEQQAKDSEARALRAEVANAKGLTPTQAKRLIGSTREELEADADELLKDIGTQKKNNNVVPREGNSPKKAGTDNVREFTRGLFGDA